jgi:hypothetical protein
LEELIGGFSRNAASNNIQDNTSDTSGNNIAASTAGDGNNYSQSRSISTSRSIIAAFGRKPVDNRGQESIFSESVSISITISSSSVFVPSL